MVSGQLDRGSDYSQDSNVRIDEYATLIAIFSNCTSARKGVLSEFINTTPLYPQRSATVYLQQTDARFLKESQSDVLIYFPRP